ncbi:MAG: DUF2283 domain-containing protein [Candidatus Diapherotrites archaeon]
MKYRYDKETDIMVIELSKDKPDFAEQKDSIITHYDKNNKPVEIEILEASKATKDMLAAIKTQNMHASA